MRPSGSVTHFPGPQIEHPSGGISGHSAFSILVGRKEDEGIKLGCIDNDGLTLTDGAVGFCDSDGENDKEGVRLTEGAVGT
mmetsp:Transcript_15274/g.22524  ORF Transcript_15274/g.22524 Transcript_15274/m.22524 type:complete len:81 (+) Transcript_15274:1869-2111(+)